MKIFELTLDTTLDNARTLLDIKETLDNCFGRKERNTTIHQIKNRLTELRKMVATQVFADHYIGQCDEQQY